MLDRPLPGNVNHAVIFLEGHGSAYDGEPAADPNVQPFSYRGLDPQDRPLPYAARDTYRSIASSVALLAKQVELLHRRTGRPVALIGQSEGAMVARTYLADRPHPAVDILAMFSPLINAGRSYYPPHPTGAGGWPPAGSCAPSSGSPTSSSTAVADPTNRSSGRCWTTRRSTATT